MILRAMLTILSFLLLGAHFLRAGNLVVMIICLMAPGLLLIKARWSLYLVQAFSYGGVLVWLHTTFTIYLARAALGLPWGRALIIMGAVTLLTLVSGLLLHSPHVKECYPVSRPST